MPGDTLTPDVSIDARGAACPGPLMELISVIRQKPSGAVIALLSNNSQTAADLNGYLAKSGHALLASEQVDDYWRFVVRKK